MQLRHKLSLPILALLLVLAGWWKSHQTSIPAPLNQPTEVNSVPVPSSSLVAPLGADQDIPQVERILSATGEAGRIIHRDPKGRSPLEKVNTPAGWVTIQRTFKEDGTLVKEEAFLDGRPVPVP